MRFSLVIPVAPERNAEILESIKNISFPKSEFQVIVVRGKSPSANRNKGAEKSKGEIIGFLDDDAVVDKSLLMNADMFFKKYPDMDIVGGPQLTPSNDKRFAKVSGYALSSKFGAWKMSSRYNVNKVKLDVDETFLTSANLFCKKEVTQKIKFDVKLFPGEDPKFIEDAKNAGFKTAYNPEMIIYHRRRPDMASLVKQIFNYGGFRPKKESIIQTLKKPFFLIPSIFFIYLIFLFFAASFFSPIRFLFFPLILYLFLDIIFSFYESFKNKDLKAVLLLPFIFPIIHLSYGVGMVYAYIKKFQIKLPLKRPKIFYCFFKPFFKRNIWIPRQNFFCS